MCVWHTDSGAGPQRSGRMESARAHDHRKVLDIIMQITGLCGGCLFMHKQQKIQKMRIRDATNTHKLWITFIL